MDLIPNSPGAYAIELLLSEPLTITVGQFGEFKFPQGVYIYSGSAFGPGGLSARLGRHMRAKSKKPHWHIDYLREITHMRDCCYILAITGITNGKPVECGWGQALMTVPGAVVPVRGFGASDCPSACHAHLVCFPFEKLDAKGDSPILMQEKFRGLLADAIEAPLEDLVSAGL